MSTYVLTCLTLLIFFVHRDAGSPIEPNTSASMETQTTQKSPSIQLKIARKRFNVTLEEANSLTEDQVNLLLAKNSYCKCRCCQTKSPESCSRHNQVQLPLNYQCPPNFCSNVLKNSCQQRNRNRCDKACFCQKCKYKLKSNDLRCSGELEPAHGCHCSGHETRKDICTPQKHGTAHVLLYLEMAKRNRKFISCNMGCFCTKCDHNVLGKVFKEVNIGALCGTFSVIPPNCTKPCPPCPSIHAVLAARETLGNISVLQGSHG